MIPVAHASPLQDVGLLAFKQRLMSVDWQLKIDGKPLDFCRDRYVFESEDRMLILSGEERIAAKWRVFPVPGTELIGLAQTYTVSNRKPDCQGQITEIGGPDHIRYYKDLGNGDLQVCWRESEDSCFGVIQPLQPEVGV
ncbi:MAG: hypothetical protein AAGB16_10860 [Pseudomonadota bacterium]